MNDKLREAAERLSKSADFLSRMPSEDGVRALCIADSRLAASVLLQVAEAETIIWYCESGHAFFALDEDTRTICPNGDCARPLHETVARPTLEPEG